MEVTIKYLDLWYQNAFCKSKPEICKIEEAAAIYTNEPFICI